jgi:hypothetical protein
MKKIELDSVVEYANKIKDCTEQLKTAYDEIENLNKFVFDEQERQINEPSNYDNAYSIVSESVEGLRQIVKSLPSDDVLMRQLTWLCVGFNTEYQQELKYNEEMLANIFEPKLQDFTLGNVVYSMAKSQIIAKLHDKENACNELKQETLYKTGNGNYFQVISTQEGVTAKALNLTEAKQFFNDASMKYVDESAFLIYA